jgi:RNA polymerase sigma factor (sigma-70 family)
VPEQKAGLAQRQSAVAAGAERTPDSEFADFYRGSYRRLLAILMALDATQAEAEDAIHDAMQDLITKWSEVREPFPYAAKAAIRFMIKARERHRRLHARLAGVAERDQTTDDPSMWENVEIVTALLDELPPTQRAVLALIYDEFTPTEIARLLGKTPVAVRQNLFAARKRAKEALASMASTDQRLDQPLETPDRMTTSGKEAR